MYAGANLGLAIHLVINTWNSLFVVKKSNVNLPFWCLKWCYCWTKKCELWERMYGIYVKYGCFTSCYKDIYKVKLQISYSTLAYWLPFLMQQSLPKTFVCKCWIKFQKRNFIISWFLSPCNHNHVPNLRLLYKHILFWNHWT